MKLGRWEDEAERLGSGVESRAKMCDAEAGKTERKKAGKLGRYQRAAISYQQKGTGVFSG
ncbi:MAG: hypothetical protein HY730_09530 [Candidatus Tectomicrobia bacterium]|uniref:Uncharacterized protein n=1 Tax=Tectimicrobiota bacterium TaxID=2528274 RepID=A0A933LRP4_UNCTE|nr:hypothetical protein [Candidatus Tectomicrobia bacterium]